MSAPGDHAGAAILTVNAGSSSLKFALYPLRRPQSEPGARIGAALFSGNIEGLQVGGKPLMRLCLGAESHSEALPATDPETAKGADGFTPALAALNQVITRHAGGLRLRAIAHRIVHGGARYANSIALDDDALVYLTGLEALAPLHQPHNLAGVRAFARNYPDLPQIGCFDTAFHATLPLLEQTFALPRELTAAGIRRYGFHGLSYRYVAASLLQSSARAKGKALIAHLGNGASICALQGGVSIATSMGFSALEGLMMGTRSGSLDPGVLLHLLRQGWSGAQLERMLYSESGLRGVSGISADMRTLQASDQPAARFAIDLFIHRLVRECCALTGSLGGLDLLAFTGGIGEHDAAVRGRACEALGFLGVRLDPAANLAAGAADGEAGVAIHAADSRVEVWVVPTDEGRVAAGDALNLIGGERCR